MQRRTNACFHSLGRPMCASPNPKDCLVRSIAKRLANSCHIQNATVLACSRLPGLGACPHVLVKQKQVADATGATPRAGDGPDPVGHMVHKLSPAVPYHLTLCHPLPHPLVSAQPATLLGSLPNSCAIAPAPRAATRPPRPLPPIYSFAGRTQSRLPACRAHSYSLPAAQSRYSLLRWPWPWAAAAGALPLLPLPFCCCCCWWRWWRWCFPAPALGSSRSSSSSGACSRHTLRAGEGEGGARTRVRGAEGSLSGLGFA